MRKLELRKAQAAAAKAPPEPGAPPGRPAGFGWPVSAIGALSPVAGMMAGFSLRALAARDRKLQVPELPQSRPRPVRLTGLGWFLAVFGVLLPAGALVGGFWLYSSAVRSRRTSELIERAGVPAYGYVVELTRTRGDHPRYYVSYGYNAAGRSRRGRNSVGSAFWAKLGLGSIVDIRYLPSEPSRSWIRGFEPRGVPAWIGPLVALHLALAGIFPWYAIRRQWMLLAEGRPAEARVMKSEKLHHSHGGQHYQIYYEFRVMSGATRAGRYASQKGPPADGTTIRIVYDPDQPERNMPYPLPLVRPA